MSDTSTTPSEVNDENNASVKNIGDIVSLYQKLSIGSGFLAKFLGIAGVAALAIPVYQMTLGVSPVLLGIAMAIPRFWDAWTDPLMGKISDNTHSRWGRRRPYIVAGAWLSGISFAMIWMVPQDWSGDYQILYFLVTSLIFYTCFTVFSVPLTSLSYEMTPDYNERTRVMAYASLFTKCGEFMYQWLFPIAQLAIFSSVIFGVRAVGWIVGIVCFGILGMLPGLLVKERYYKKTEGQAKVKILGSLKDAFNNKAFVVVVSLVLVQWICGIFASSMDYYLLVYYMFDGDIAEGSIWKGVLSTSYAICGILSIGILTYISSRFGKINALITVYVLYTIGGVIKWFVYVPGNSWLIIADAFTGAPLWIAISLIVPSMMADICDDDELKHSRRREGMFSSLYSWVEKTAASLAFLVVGVILAATGFDAALGGNQSEDSIFYMRLVLAVGSSITGIIGLLILRNYPLSYKRTQETRAQLELRRGQV